MLIDKQKLSYYKNKKLARQRIKEYIRKNGLIIHGAKAMNQFLPDYLKVPTRDYDVFSKRAKKDAHKTEKQLDRAYKGNFFYVKKGKNKKTWRIMSNVTKEEVADYTNPKRRIHFIKIDKMKYASPKHFRRHIKRTLRNPKAKHRHSKDKEALLRIRLAMKQNYWALRKKGMSHKSAFNKIRRRFNGR
jgi:hypothetical protein